MARQVGQSASGPGAMPRGWRLSYYSRIAEASDSAPASNHAGGVTFQVSPCGAPTERIWCEMVTNAPKSASAGILPFCFRIDKIR